MSGDISLNPGPVNRHHTKDHEFEVFTRKGLHFIHSNINSVLPKIEELQYMADDSNATIIYIPETSLDNTVYDFYITINGCATDTNDRNRHGGGIACYIRDNICFNMKIYF